MTTSSNTSDTDGVVCTCRRAAELLHSEALNFDELRTRCMGNITLVHRVLHKFQKRFPEELAELNKALELGDTEHIARVAHRVKGTSASVSAKNLQQTAAEIEDLGRAGRATEIPSRIERLRDEWEECLRETTTLLSAGDVA